MTREEKIDFIKNACKDAIENTHLRIIVCEDGETGELYESEDLAGGNSMPIAVWDGRDKEIVEFCYQCCSPEDCGYESIEDMVEDELSELDVDQYLKD